VRIVQAVQGVGRRFFRLVFVVNGGVGVEVKEKLNEVSIAVAHAEPERCVGGKRAAV